MDIYSIEWEYEDKLPEMSDLDYDIICVHSKVIDGVRMFPFITHYLNDDGQARRVYLGA